MNFPLQSLRDCAAALCCAVLIIGCVVYTDAIGQTMPFAPVQTPAANPNKDALEISALLRAGRVDAASARVDALLAKNPKDAQTRFLKGLVLTDQGKTDDAIQSFRTLTEDYPELPEPYNNLASLYAAKGQLDNARMALESAVQSNPSYVTAHENLGDLYARMATQAYDKVLQLDKSNAATQAKVSALRSAMAAGARTSGSASASPSSTAPAPAATASPTTAPSAPAAAKLPGR